MRLATAALAARRALAAASHSGHEGGGQAGTQTRSASFPRRRCRSSLICAACVPPLPTARTWKILTIVLAVPGVAICMVNAYMKSQEHPHGQPDFVPYSHLRIRTKVSPGRNGTARHGSWLPRLLAEVPVG